MDALGWDSCDVVLVTGDAYVDHPSFGMALVGRLLEAQGFRVGILPQPQWRDVEAFRALGRPNVCWGVTGGNMDSMVNRYTSDRKIRSDDAYSPGGAAGLRPDRSVIVYAQRCREAFGDVPLLIGGIEASLRRIAHYDYWSDVVRRSILLDAKADLLLFGNAERALVELTHRLAAGEPIDSIRDLRGTAFMVSHGWKPADQDNPWQELDSLAMDTPGKVDRHPDPYAEFPSPGAARHPLPPAGEGFSHPSPAGGGGAGGEGKTATPPKPVPADLLAHARDQRSHQTDAEQLLWGILRANRFLGLKFRRQHPVGQYILDFYCDELKLAVELDGGQHADQQAYDATRSQYLNAQGIEVLRYWNNQMLGETEAVLESLYQAVQRKAPSPPAPPPQGEGSQAAQLLRYIPRDQRLAAIHAARAHTVVRLPAYEQVEKNPVLYAHASRVFHLESNPGNARAMVQAHGERDVWLNPPPIPLTTPEMDAVYDLPYARAPHPGYGEAKIPAWEMIRFSVNIMRGCFGGCTFCSITEHEGRIIQSRSEASILREIEEIRDKTPGFTGTISDLGGPTANMYRMACKDPQIESACRRLSCVFPDICDNLGTDHGPLIRLYRKARAIRGVKRVLIGSGLRYDLAVRSPEYVQELVTHHVGGLLKIAPEHTEAAPLAKMMKPGIGAYDRFKELFERFSREAGKKQHLVPYFIAAHPGTSDEDMVNLALWLKANQFRLDQVQTFLPTPMALATTMYHSGKNPLRKVSAASEEVASPRSARQRRLHKALLRYHDPEGWPLIREALRALGRSDLIGSSPRHLVPRDQPVVLGAGGAEPRRTGKAASPVGARRSPPPARRGAAPPPASGKPRGRRP